MVPNLKLYGKVNLDFELDNEMFSYDFLVAEIDELDIVLGQDFLEDFDVNVKFGKACMKIGKHKIKLLRQETNKFARIRLANAITVPPESEITINACTLTQTYKPPLLEFLYLF